MKKHIIIALLLVGVFILTPVFTHAQTRDQLVSQLISQLQQLIIQLQAQLKTLQAAQISRPIVLTSPTHIIQPPPITVPNPIVKHCLPTGICFDNRIFLITEGLDGNFIDSENGYIDRQITKYYSQNTQKEADFLVTFRDWDYPSTSGGGVYSIFVTGNDTGMGMYLTQASDFYGTKGNLKSFVAMPNIKILSVQNFPNDLGAFNSNIHTFVHEIGHHWLAHFDNPSLIFSRPITSSHYDRCTIFNNGNFADLMMDAPFIWQKTGDTVFSSPTPDGNNPLSTKKFSNLSLYVMGLLPDTNVTPVQIIRDGTSNCPSSGKVENENISITGSTDQVTLSDLIKVYGDRSPKFPNTQKDFTVQVALLAHKNSQLTQNDADTFKRYLDEVEKYLPFAVSNKATFQLIRN